MAAVGWARLVALDTKEAAGLIILLDDIFVSLPLIIPLISRPSSDAIWMQVFSFFFFINLF